MPCSLAPLAPQILSAAASTTASREKSAATDAGGDAAAAAPTASSRPSVAERLEQRRRERDTPPQQHSFIDECQQQSSSSAVFSAQLARQDGFGIRLSAWCVLVGSRLFVVDAARLGRASAVFAEMFRPAVALRGGARASRGKPADTPTRLDYDREIVDESWQDVAELFRCLHHNEPIRCLSEWNFATVLRLADKYRVESLRDACEKFLVANNFKTTKADQVLSLLIAADEFRLCRDALASLIERLADERDALATYARLHLSRYLPHNLYRSILLTNRNVLLARLYAEMCGHAFRVSTTEARVVALDAPAVCDACARILSASDAQVARCVECARALCRAHWPSVACTTDYGSRLGTQVAANALVLDYGNDEERLTDGGVESAKR